MLSLSSCQKTIPDPLYSSHYYTLAGNELVDSLNAQSSPDESYSFVKLGDENINIVVIKRTLYFNGDGSETSEDSFYNAYDLNNYEMGRGIDEFFDTHPITLNSLTPQSNNNFLCQKYECTAGGGPDDKKGSHYWGAIFEETDIFSKDLEKIGANEELNDRIDLAFKLEANFGLSEQRANEIAKITIAFNKIKNKRSLSSKEMDVFTQTILGVNYSVSKKAFENHIQGNSSDLDRIIHLAARKNDISPEAVSDLVGEFLL